MKPGEAPLSQHLVGAYCRAVGEIKAARLVYHGYSHAFFLVGVKKFLGQSLVLSAEYDIAFVGIFNVAVGIYSLGGIKEVIAAAGLFKKIREAFVVGNVKKMPIIQARVL